MSQSGPPSLTNHARSQRLRADLLLLMVAIIWGSAFVAQRMAAVQAGVFLFNGLRFLLGAIVLLPFALLQRKNPNRLVFTPAKHMPGVLLAGGLLWAGAALQQAGLIYTTAGNAGFITGLYVVLIPIFLAVFWRKPARITIWLAAAMAAVGMFLLSTGGQITHLNPGDLLELAGAVMWALHVIVIGLLVQRMELLHLAIGQYLVCAALSLLTGMFLEMEYLPSLVQSWPAILYTGALSVGVGYTLQAAGQRTAPPADAAILLSSEAVFAALFGWLILSEILTPIQLLGCAIIFAGILLAQADVFRRKGHILTAVIILGVLLSQGCSAPAPGTPVVQNSPPSPTATHPPTATVNPTPSKHSASTPVRPTPTPDLQPCSLLQGYPLSALDGMISNPFNPPPPGRDDPHQGIDFSIVDPNNGMALPGASIQAVLPGRVAMVTENRFPYGNSILIETPLELLAGLTISAGLPTPAPTVVPHPALTCPSGQVWEPPASDSRSLYMLYAHMNQPAELKAGDPVACGQVFGSIGQSGNALNPHLHLETRLGPARARFASMAHYDSSATPEEMSAYCQWRVSGLFQLADPMTFLHALP